MGTITNLTDYWTLDTAEVVVDRHGWATAWGEDLPMIVENEFAPGYECRRMQMCLAESAGGVHDDEPCRMGGPHSSRADAALPAGSIADGHRWRRDSRPATESANKYLSELSEG
jgi:hypothetical protein